MPNHSDQSAASAGGAIRYRFFGNTEVGLVREHNEDNFLVADLSSDTRISKEDAHAEGTLGRRGLVLAVCDGMGGAAAGEVASVFAPDAHTDRRNASFAQLRKSDVNVELRNLGTELADVGASFTDARFDYCGDKTGVRKGRPYVGGSGSSSAQLSAHPPWQGRAGLRPALRSRVGEN